MFKKFFKEFSDFAIKGNVIDLATAVIIGGAFGKIISSLVADVIMPIVALFTGSSAFNDWKITLRGPIIDNGVVVKTALVMNIGTFIQNVVDFLIIALLVFLMIKTINRLKEQIAKKIGKEETDKNLTEPKDIQLLSEIRDLLKENLSAK